MIELAEILAEDTRRMAANAAPFDPVSGLGSTGSRFLLDLPGLERQWLPESMRADPFVASLLGAGSLDAAIAAGRSLRVTQREREEAAARLDRLRMLHDFPYWAATRAFIKNKRGGEDILFILNRPQRRLVETLEADRIAGRPIRLILLKARQWGGSTCIQLYMAWLQLVHRTGLNSLIIAHQGVGSDEIKDMFDRMIMRYPAPLLAEDPANPPDSKGRLVEWVGKTRTLFRVPARNCKVKVGTAERPDSCRGGDYSLVHCSEVGIWRKTLGKTPEQMVRSACSGVLFAPMTMIVYESTANGTGNFFHREYEAARRGESQFSALFVAWYEIDQYSLPFASESARSDFAALLVGGRDQETSTSDRRQPGSYLWWLWERGATLEALHWYVTERMKYGEHALMASEYPSDDVEAFVHSGARVFDRYRVEALRAGCRPPSFTGEIDVPGLRDAAGRLLPDSERARLLPGVAFTPLGSGGWQVWDLPETEPGVSVTDRHVVVVDVGGRGAKADWSVVAIFDRLPMASGQGPRIVAQWRGHTDFDILAWRAAMAAQFYGQALLVIESNTIETRDPDRDVDGDQSSFLLNRLREVYPNLYARLQSEQEVVRGAPRRFGFHTNTATKPMIISTLVKVIREGLYTERDEACLDEYLQYERRQNGSYGAIAGCHDDLLMTRAIGLHICYHELPPPRCIAAPASPANNAGARSNYAVW